MGIVAVQFESRYRQGLFAGKEYNYIANIELEPGDVIIVPTYNGDGVARVTRRDVEESEIPENILPMLRAIEEKVVPDTANRLDVIPF